MRGRAQYLKEGNKFNFCESAKEREGNLKEFLTWVDGIVHKVLRVYVHIFLGRRSTF